MRTIPKDFSEMLKAWRLAKALSQAQAAAELKVKKRTLQDWEQLRNYPKLETAAGVLRRLNTDGFNL